MVELQRLQTADVRYAISRSCGDIVEALILLHCPEKMSMRSCAEKRSLYAREPARSASAPPRKRWFHKAPLERVHSQMTVCDELTRKLVGAITTWHDIHSNLLRLSIDKSCSDISISDQSSISSDSDESANGADYANSNAARFSLSNPELTSMQIKQMFPELSEHWRCREEDEMGVFSNSVQNISQLVVQIPPNNVATSAARFSHHPQLNASALNSLKQGMRLLAAPPAELRSRVGDSFHRIISSCKRLRSLVRSLQRISFPHNHREFPTNHLSSVGGA